MIESLDLGYIWGVESKIELLSQKGKEQILLERVQSDPFYTNEETAFSTDGQILRIQKVTDIVIPKPGQPKYDRSKLGMELNHKSGIIQSTYPGTKENSLKHAIEKAYNDEANEFLNQLKKINAPPGKQKLKGRAITILENIRSHNFTQYLLYTIKE